MVLRRMVLGRLAGALAAGAVSAGALLWVAAVPAAATGATGDAATLKFYAQVVRATALAPGVSYVYFGYSSVQESTNGTFNWYQSAPPPAGYFPVVDHVHFAQAAGKVIWAEDQMVPTSACRPTPARMCHTLTVLLTPSGLFSQVAGAGRCWQRSHGSILSMTKVGWVAGYGLYGNFQPMRRVGNTVYVTSTYPWGKTRTATEIDTISYSSRLPSLGQMSVPASVGYAAFQYHWTAKWLHSSLPKPNFTVCA